jgi:hypothetical protein
MRIEYPKLPTIGSMNQTRQGEMQTMKVNELFFLARTDKNLSSLHVQQRDGRQYMYLCIDIKKKYSTAYPNFETVETPIEIKFERYDYTQRPIQRVSFAISAGYEHRSHLRTFLKKIRKESEVSFIVIVNNDNENIKNAGMECHQLYGIVDNNTYLLESFVGPVNTVSAVQF